MVVAPVSRYNDYMLDATVHKRIHRAIVNIGPSKTRSEPGFRSTDHPMTRSPDLQSFLCFLGEVSALGLSSFLASFVSFGPLASFAPASPSEDDAWAAAPFFA